ncbi:hypothetical protein [Lentzea albida]|uniref:hypothetical protein n=1 Tax=Lentzea albida TaxID=65499 RepID=UPI001C430938|nr:hypothetical protein [Lentzea albida]
MDQEALRLLARAMREESDGKQLRKDLAGDLREALGPARTAVRASIMGMSSAGMSTGPSLRKSVAQKVAIQVRMSGKATGATLRTRKTPNIRGFDNAPKRLNRRRGWRHPLWGDVERWVSQLGKPNWFDDPIRRGRAAYRDAVLAAMEKTAKRIKSRVG